MEKEFVPYEQALALKELGFGEKCISVYLTSTKKFYPIYRPYTNNEQTDEILRPLYQQAFRWFREKHNLKGHVEGVEYLDGTPETYHWSVFNKCNSGYNQLTHEEAELECLKVLIELVKTDKNG